MVDDLASHFLLSTDFTVNAVTSSDGQKHSEYATPEGPYPIRGLKAISIPSDIMFVDHIWIPEPTSPEVTVAENGVVNIVFDVDQVTCIEMLTRISPLLYRLHETRLSVDNGKWISPPISPTTAATECASTDQSLTVSFATK